MSMNDPLGDMLTRIRNAQMRRKGKVQTPGSRLRAHVLDVLQSEGYIRGYSTTEYGNGRTEFEIELKYSDGTPVIRDTTWATSSLVITKRFVCLPAACSLSSSSLI